MFEEMSAEMGLKHVEELRLRHVLQAAVRASTPPALVPVVAAEKVGAAAMEAAEATVVAIDGGKMKKRVGFADLEEELMRVCKAMKRAAPGSTTPSGPRPSPAIMAAIAA
jgi:hypothetical protein